MKKRNIPLIAGSIILVLILIVMVFPQLFTSHSPYNMQKFRFSIIDGALDIQAAPYPPSSELLFGSDDMGRDVLSRIVYGTRLTIILGILVALGRFILAVTMALNAGFGSQVSKSIIKQFNIVFSAIPALLISVIVLRFDYFVGLDKINSIIAFVIVLSFVSWASLGSTIMERVEIINKQAFIKGEVAIGKKKIKIALENVIPHLAPELVILFFMEIARALSMIMQLGIFSVFIGNLKIIASSNSGILTFYNVSFEPEWASTLGAARNMIRVAPWSLIFPAIAFFISVLAFNLFGEGLRAEMQKKDSRFIIIVRNIVSLDYTRVWKSISKKVKLVIAIMVFLIITAFTTQHFIDKSYYKFDIDDSKEMSYEQVIIGTKQAQETAIIIAEKMASLGIDPLGDDGYIIEYDTREACINTSQSFEINNNANGGNLEINNDYTFIQSGDLDYSANVYDATKDDLYNLIDYSRFDEMFVLIEKEHYNDASISYFINQITMKSKAKGILLVARSNELIHNNIINKSDDVFVLLISQELSKEIMANIDDSISIMTTTRELAPVGNNVVGIYRGADPYIQEEAILIGLNYNYFDADGDDILQFNLELMEKLATQYENKRSIIFMFFDGTISDEYHGIHSISQDYPYSSSKTKVFIDLTGLVATDFDTVVYSDVQAPFTRAFAWSVGHQMKSLLAENNMDITSPDTVYIDTEYYFTESYSMNAMFWDRGIATIHVATEGQEGGKHNIRDIGSMILEIINKNNY